MSNEPGALSKPKTGLDEFREVITDYKSLTSWTVSGAIVTPLTDFILKLGPPWPTGVPAITSVAEFLSLTFIFHSWFTLSQAKLSRRLIIALIVLCLSFIVYLVLFSSYTFRHTKTRDLDVKGFELTEGVKKVMKEFPDYTEDDALKGNQYDPEGVWTNRSITAMRIAILVTWLILFVSLSIFLGTFVMVQRRYIVGTSSGPSVLATSSTASPGASTSSSTNGPT